MVKRRRSFADLKKGYLFPEIARRKALFLKDNPQAKIISLGVGDTVLPLASSIASALQKSASSMGTLEGYSGYGQDQGMSELRKKIASHHYQDRINPDEIFISDGAKCDIGRLQVLFGHEVSIGLQDPAYPVYYDGSILQGVKTVHFLPCLPENHFFPRLDQAPPLDILYLCNPNNPTGSACTREELEGLVKYAKAHQMLIIFDAAYSAYIQDDDRPRSIYEIPGANEVAIEVHSLSKTAGFTGVRLGWTVVPKTLSFECGASIWQDWHRLSATIFNGASLISQQGALAAFEERGMQEIKETLAYYMENAKLLKQAFVKLGYMVHGGEHAPYLWIQTPNESSWDVFETFLKTKHFLITPGVGYGPSGEHFFRVSAFAYRAEVNEVIKRLFS